MSVRTHFSQYVVLVLECIALKGRMCNPRPPNEKFGGLEKSLYLCIVFKRKPLQARSCKHAEVAQLVEHNLAKVRVAGSSPVFRSKKTLLAIRFGRLYFCAQNGVEQLRVLVVDKSKEYY